MSTGLFKLLDDQKNTVAAFDARVTKLEAEAAASSDVAALSATVAQLRTDLTALETTVGAPDAPPAS